MDNYGEKLRQPTHAPALMVLIGALVWGIGGTGLPLATKAVAQVASPGQTIGIPAYFYPAGNNVQYWERLRSGYPAVSTVIATGLRLEGTSPDTNYQAQMTLTHNAGIKMLAYVATTSGHKPIAQVKTEIDRAFAWYSIDGIFFDEAVAYPVTCGQVNYYQEINQYVKAKNSASITVLNHGQILPECYANVSDIMMNAETSYQGYTSTWRPWGWEHNYPAEKFWHLIHSAPDEAAMTNAVQLSRTRGAGRVFVTSATASSPGGPYGSLPSTTYWNRELAEVAAPVSTTTTVAPAPTTTVAPAPTTTLPTTTTTRPTTPTTQPAGSPVVTSFSPMSGPVGTTVTIRGTGFTGVNLVTLSGAPIVIVSVSDTTLVVRTNSWSKTGRFYVSRPGGRTTTSAGTFSVVR